MILLSEAFCNGVTLLHDVTPLRKASDNRMIFILKICVFIFLINFCMTFFKVKVVIHISDSHKNTL